jgi:hypothetical protein
MRMSVPVILCCSIFAALLMIATTSVADCPDGEICRCQYAGSCTDVKGCNHCPTESDPTMCCQKCTNTLNPVSACSGPIVPVCDIHFTPNGCGNFEAGTCTAGRCGNWRPTSNSCGSSSSCVS